MKHTPEFSSPAFHDRCGERGVALIIVLGFLGLMVMMAVAFMVQARVERMVADSTLEGMRARQIAQTAIAAATQDYMNYIKSFESQSDAMEGLFLSGDLPVTASYHYSDLYYGNTNLWCGEAADWLPPHLKSSNSGLDLDDIQDMEWIWVREKPNNRSRILGRYAYACFNLSGGVDANLLGRDYGTSPVKSGSETNRNNVRKMVLDAFSLSTETPRQEKLARYQAMWQGFDTPVALVKLTDGEDNSGDEKDKDRWQGVDITEERGKSGPGRLETDGLSCYSYSATHMGNYTTECTVKDIRGNRYFSDWIKEMGGDEDEVEKALTDYFDHDFEPKGTNYPSVKAVPMFNEIQAEVQLVRPDENPDDKWQLKVTLTPEFWCPFPSRIFSKSCTLKPPSMGGGAAQSSSSDDVWVRILGTTSDGIFQPTLEQKDVSPAELTVTCTDKPETPADPGKFVYTFDIKGVPEVDGAQLPIKQLRVAAVIFQNGWTLTSTAGGKAVDSTPPVDKYPDKLTISISPNTLSPTTQGNTGVGYIEVDDPRLNHIAGRWSLSSEGSIGKTNTCVDAAKAKAKEVMGYAPGDYMFCRNGDMETPAELGFIPICDGRNTPWVTLNIFSEYGVPLMNSLVCDANIWNIMEKQKYKVYYTNGTINPYTLNTNILNAVFFGLSTNEVPNMSRSAGRIDKSLAGVISKVFVSDKDPSDQKFIKDGPGGWTRALRSKEIQGLNKNQRVMLAHNTWGLFNESDSLFLVFVVAQSISEAPEKVNPVGDWNDREDMITGERWAVALCWMDTAKNGPSDTLQQEMDIIMFKYLNE